MAEENNVPMEGITLDSSDFGQQLDFGIQDTQIIGSKQLASFLTGEVSPTNDPNKIVKNTEKDTTTDTNKPDSTIKTDTEKVDPKVESEKKIQEAGDKLNSFLTQETVNPDQSQKTGDNQSTETNNDAGEDDENTYSILSKDLLKLGVFTQEEGEDIDVKTPEEFLERFRDEQKRGAIDILDNFLSKFGEDYRRMFDAVFVKGVNPNEYLSSFTKINSVKDLNLEEENNQIKVLREYYRTLKMDEDQITARITKLKDYNDLADEAKMYHKILLERESASEQELVSKKEKEIESRRQAEQSTMQSYAEILNDKLKSKEFDGIPLTQKEAQEVFNYLSNKPYKLENGDLLSEFDKDILELNRPANHELKIKMALLLKNKLDLSGIKKTAASKKTDELFNLNIKKDNKQNKERSQNKSFFE